MTELRTLKEVELELERRRYEDPLGLVYKPHSKQIEVHRSRFGLTLVIGGNRSGKSWSAVAESQYYCLGRSVWAEVPDPPVQVWYIMPSLPMFRRAIRPIFQQLAPWKEIKKVYWRDGIVSYKNGSELHFLSSDMGRRRLQGAAIHLGIMDETPEEDVFEELQARVLSTRGRMLTVFAPIDAQTYWLRDKIYTPWLAGERRDIDIVHMPVADEQGNSLVPWFNRSDIEDMERKWPDPAVRAARIYGQFITKEGLVFKSFSQESHIVSPFDIPSNWARWFVVDPQYHRFAALFFAADEKGNYVITDEYFSQNETLAQRAERLAVIAGERDRPLPVYVDSANPQDVAELNWHFNRIGASLAAIPLPMQKNIDKMILRTHALLEPDDSRLYPKAAVTGDLYGAPRLLIFNTLCSNWKWNEKDMVCSRLIWEMQRLTWDKNQKPDKVSANGADACDCLVYGCSILQVGQHLPEIEAWQEGMKESDVLVWKLIEKADGYRQRMRED